jgi:hypothetical protein
MGCIEQENGPESNDPKKDDSNPPIPHIKIPENGFFGQTITFDASKSYDPDGTITKYTWIFGDDTTKQGVTVTHTFEQDSSLSLDVYPVSYEVALELVDNDELKTYSNHVLQLYPSQLTFYLNKETLQMTNPPSNSESIKPSLGLLANNPIPQLNYHLNPPIILQPCSWKINLEIEKPILSTLTDITIKLVNESGSIIAEDNVHINVFPLWREKTITHIGSISQQQDFSAVIIKIKGYSLRSNVQIRYGSETSSFIQFAFENI